MLAKSNHILFMFVLGVVTFLSSTSGFAQNPASDSSQPRAQSEEERARISLHNRMINIVNAMTSRVNTEGADFNKRLQQMNAVAPLETGHLDSAGLASDVPQVLEFLEYLKICHHSSDSLDRAFNDSMFAINADLPADQADEGIKVIEVSFNEDRAAFNNFLSSLDKVYAKVLDILLYLQHAHYNIVKDQLTFSSKENFNEYSKLLKAVDAANVELNKSSEALRKANAAANERVKSQNSKSSE